MTIGLSVPGVAFLLDPIRRKSGRVITQELARLSSLKVGEPRSFAIIAERRDAWVQYPREPVGLVWLVRQPEGGPKPVVAFTAECPHIGCQIGLTDDTQGFVCPCHRAEFDFQGKKKNAVAPRGMDTLEVELTQDEDPAVIVHFQRFRTQQPEKVPLV